MHQNLPSVFGVPFASNQAAPLQAVHQLHRAVMTQEQTRCDFPDRRLYFRLHPAERQQSLVLLWFHAIFARRMPAEL